MYLYTLYYIQMACKTVQRVFLCVVLQPHWLYVTVHVYVCYVQCRCWWYTRNVLCKIVLGVDGTFTPGDSTESRRDVDATQLVDVDVTNYALALCAGEGAGLFGTHAGARVGAAHTQTHKKSSRTHTNTDFICIAVVVVVIKGAACRVQSSSSSSS